MEKINYNEIMKLGFTQDEGVAYYALYDNYLLEWNKWEKFCYLRIYKNYKSNLYQMKNLKRIKTLINFFENKYIK